MQVTISMVVKIKVLFEILPLQLAKYNVNLPPYHQYLQKICKPFKRLP